MARPGFRALGRLIESNINTEPIYDSAKNYIV